MAAHGSFKAAPGFFQLRQRLDISPKYQSGIQKNGMVDYVSLPKTIATVISGKKATLHELQTVYGLQDLWDMLEIIMVDSHNARVLNEIG